MALVDSYVIPALNNKLNGCSLEQEGNDFYIIGADSVRKKLGSAKLPFLGLDYNGGWACMTFLTSEIYQMDKFTIRPQNQVYYQLTDDHGLKHDWYNATQSGYNNQFATNTETDILNLCKGSTKKYFKIITSMLDYGIDHPFELYIC